MGSMMWLTSFLHNLPHLKFDFGSVPAEFQPEDVDYRQALGFWAVVTLLLATLFLLVVVVFWVQRCCRRPEQNTKSNRQIRNLSTTLFIISLFCFVWMGGCLFGNEHLNRGVTAVVSGLDDVARNVKLADVQRRQLNTTKLNITTHLEILAILVNKSAGEGTVNQTLLNDTLLLFKNLSVNVDRVNASLHQVGVGITDFFFLQTVRDWLQRLEFERWLVCAALLSIMIVVLFAGVVAFCRRSKKGVVVFSAFGIVMFLVAWLLLAMLLALSLALSDYCAQPEPFLERHMGVAARQSLHFYRVCDPKPDHDNVPNALGVGNTSDTLTLMQNVESDLDKALQTTFNNSKEMKQATALLAADLSQSLKQIGALESTVSCYSMRDDFETIHNGLCTTAAEGATVLLFCLLLIGIFLFVLLMFISCAWLLYTKRPSDYVEVDEDDPFFPRANDSAIPVDIYGTHVYNPRTRFANSIESDTAENGRLVNGGGERTTLDRSTATNTTPLWQRGTAPPAVGPNSMNRLALREESTDRHIERFNV